jgi:uncharacterized surface protein with fasciclin (FAS1) repeats
MNMGGPDRWYDYVDDMRGVANDLEGPNMKRILTATAALSLVASGAMAADHHKDKSSKAMMKEQTIVATASSNDDLSTLVAAVKAADLVETLQGTGPFTVFAPSDDGFATVQSTVDELLRPENKARLQSVLKYHVVPADLSMTDLMLITKANGGRVDLDTVAGGNLTVMLNGGMLSVTDANGDTVGVVQADVKTSNGVVHVIDGVLMPAQ